MYKIRDIRVPGGVVDIEAQSQKELWELAAFYQSLPLVCPVDGTPTRFGFKEPGNFKYYVLLSSGDQVYEYAFGQATDGGQLFPGKMKGAGKEARNVKTWAYYDAATQKEIIVWEDGKLLQVGKNALGPVPNQAAPAAAPSTQRTGDNGYNNEVIEKRKRFSLLGRQLFAEDWPSVCVQSIKKRTGGRASEVESLTEVELDQFTASMQATLDKRTQVTDQIELAFN